MAKRADPMHLPTFTRQEWQMSHGERMAFEGLLTQVKPRLAVEIGTAQGGSLRRIAAHSEEVHSFDLVAPLEEVAELPNVTFHTGDSHQLVNDYLGQAAAAGRSIDFVLIDGDHSAEGVRRDIVDVLASDAVSRTVIVLHDTLNPEVRAGIEAASIAEHEKVALYELDLVPGYLARREPYRLTLWGGLGVIVVDAEHRRRFPEHVRDDRFHELFGVLRPSIETMAELEARGLPLDALAGPEVEAALHAERERVATAAPSDDAALRVEVARTAAQQAQLAHRLRAIESSRGWRLVLAFRAMRDVVSRRS